MSTMHHMLEQDLVKPLKSFEDNKELKEQNGLLTFCLSVQDHKHKTNFDCYHTWRSNLKFDSD